MKRMFLGRAYVALALALSVTLGGFAFYAGIWQLGLAHWFVASALAQAYLRPVGLEAWEEVKRTAIGPPRFK